MTSSDSQGIVPPMSMEFIWRAQVAAIVCAALVSGVAGALLAMLPNERRAPVLPSPSMMDGAIGIVVIKRKGDLDRRQSWGREDPQLKGGAGR